MSATAEVVRGTPTRRGVASARPSAAPEKHHPTPSAPDPERLARAVAHAFLEVEAGRRPLAQLERILAPALWQRLSQLTIRSGPGPTGNAIIAVQGQRAGDDAFDAAVVVRRGDRCGVIALRLERRGTAWRVVELARPEDSCR